MDPWAALRFWSFCLRLCHLGFGDLKMGNVGELRSQSLAELWRRRCLRSGPRSWVETFTLPWQLLCNVRSCAVAHAPSQDLFKSLRAAWILLVWPSFGLTRSLREASNFRACSCQEELAQEFWQASSLGTNDAVFVSFRNFVEKGQVRPRYDRCRQVRSDLARGIAVTAQQAAMASSSHNVNRHQAIPNHFLAADLENVR